MANALVVATLGLQGRTNLVLALIAYGSSSPVVHDIALAEDVGQAGRYIATVTTGLTGQYRVQITVSGLSRIIAQGYVYMTDAAIDHIVVDYPNVISASGRMSVDTSAEDDPSLIADVQAGLTAQGLTEERAAMLDSLEAISVGTGSVLVDHNYGGSNALAYLDPHGAGIDGAAVQAFRASDFNAGRRAATYVVGRTRTNIDGHWVLPLALDPGAYVLMFNRPGSVGGSGGFGPDFVAVTVS